VPPFTLLGAARRGGAALLINLAGASLLALAAWLLAAVTGNPGQFWFVAIGFYAVFSWACALRADDLATFELTWRTRAFVCTVLAYAIVCFTGYTVTYWAAPYAERVFGYDKVALGWALGAPAALGGFIGVIGGGWLADRLVRRFATGRLMVIAIGLLVPVPLVLIGYSTANSTLFFVCSFLLQVTTASALGASAAASQSLVLPRMRGAATAIFFIGPALIGLAFGPYTAGLVSERTGSLAVGVMGNLAVVPFGVVALLVAIRGYAAAEASRLQRAATRGEAITSA
jgi:MFS family permease